MPGGRSPPPAASVRRKPGSFASRERLVAQILLGAEGLQGGPDDDPSAGVGEPALVAHPTHHRLRRLAAVPDDVTGPSGPGPGIDPATVTILGTTCLLTPDGAKRLPPGLGARLGTSPDMGLDGRGRPGGKQLRLGDGRFLANAAAAAGCHEGYHGQDNQGGHGSTKRRRQLHLPPAWWQARSLWTASQHSQHS